MYLYKSAIYMKMITQFSCIYFYKFRKKKIICILFTKEFLDDK